MKKSLLAVAIYQIARPGTSSLLRKLMIQSGLEVPPVDRLLGYVCAVEGPLCKNPKK